MVWNLLRWPVAIAALALVLAVLYGVGPNVKRPFRWMSPGAILATLLWLVAAAGFGIYLRFANPGSAYGVVGAVLVLLFFLYLTGIVFLLGAELDALLSTRQEVGPARTRRANPGPSRNDAWGRGSGCARPHSAPPWADLGSDGTSLQNPAIAGRIPLTDPSSDEALFGAAGPVADGRVTVTGAPAKPRTDHCVSDHVPGIRFSPAELQRARDRLSAGDGLHRLLARIGGAEARDARLPMPAHFASPGFVRRHSGTLAVVGLYALLAIVPGFLISASGDRFGGEPFVKLTDWRELPGALFLYLVLAPVLWTFYLWQPRLIIEVFAGLAEGGVVGAPEPRG